MIHCQPMIYDVERCVTSNNDAIRNASANTGQLTPEEPQQHFIGCAGVLGVILEARSLEVLGQVLLAVGRIDLDHRLGERQAKQRQALVEAGSRPAVELKAMARPVAPELRP